MKWYAIFATAALALQGTAIEAGDNKIGATALDDAKAHIAQAGLEIPDHIIVSDAEVVQNVYPAVLKKYGEKLSQEQVQQSVLLCWKLKRVGDKHLGTANALVESNFAKELLEQQGALRVKSDPSNAVVFIDGQPYGLRTETVLLIGVGNHKIKAEKNDVFGEENCKVSDDDVTEVTIKLTKAKPKRKNSLGSRSTGFHRDWTQGLEPGLPQLLTSGYNRRPRLWPGLVSDQSRQPELAAPK